MVTAKKIFIGEIWYVSLNMSNPPACYVGYPLLHLLSFCDSITSSCFSSVFITDKQLTEITIHSWSYYTCMYIYLLS